MDLREIGEFDLIARIRNRLLPIPADVLKGIGDDAAVFSLPGNQLVSGADLLVEEVYSDLSYFSPYLLARKSLVVNLSDIAAMGALPCFTSLSLAIPSRTKVKFIDELFLNFLELSGVYGVSWIGENTSSSPMTGRNIDHLKGIKGGGQGCAG